MRMMDNNLIYSENGETIISVYDQSLSEVKIPQGVKKIGLRAFENCTSLSSITFPETVEDIDDYAFAGCSSLRFIVIPNTVKNIGSQVFAGCVNLTRGEIHSQKAISVFSYFESIGFTRNVTRHSIIEIKHYGL